ncbi:MAG: hypothetical protein ACXW05_14320 [Gemmatirosa sp.]
MAIRLHPIACGLLLALASGTRSGTGATPASPALAAVAGDSIVAFRLSDQFGRVHDAAEYRGRTLLLVGAGRGGRETGTAWVEHLRALQDTVGGAPVLPVVAVADLRGVPRLLRRLVRSRFPDDPGRAVLLDWDGALARRFDFDTERCTILLVGPTGRAHARRTLAAVDTALARAMLREAAQLTPSAASGSTGPSR